MSYSKHWTSQKKAHNEALKYVYRRKNGSLGSYKTPWPKVNDAGVDGIEWGTLTVIGGRPGTGKTLIKDQIVREGFDLNRGTNIRVLDFSFEMVGFMSVVRSYSAELGKSYKDICSADPSKPLSQEDFDKLHAYSKKMCDIDKFPIDLVEKSVTVEVFVKIVDAYMEEHSTIILNDDENESKVYPHVLISADHSLLFKVSKHHKSKTDMLYDLGEAITGLKRKYPTTAYIILSQLGRHVEAPERNENGKYGNYVLENDLFGGDALMQHADLVIGVNRPGKRNITYYGPNRILVPDDNFLVFHFLKARNGDTRMSFFQAHFEKMQIKEAPSPGQQTAIATSNI